MLLIQILIDVLPSFTSHSNSCDITKLDGFVVGVVYEISIVLSISNQQNLAYVMVYQTHLKSFGLA